MICPGCATPLKGKERTGRVCAHCRTRFALDPAVDGRGMNDIRIRGIVERATDHGRLRITLTQLWYLSRTHAYPWAEQEPRGVPAPVRLLVALPVAVALLVCAVLTHGGVAFFAGIAGCAALVIPSAMRHHPGRPPRSQIIPAQETFRHLMTVARPAAYGRMPKGESITVRAVERALAVSASAPGDTRTHGFLTWPQAARTGDGTAQQEGTGSA